VAEPDEPDEPQADFEPEYQAGYRGGDEEPPLDVEEVDAPDEEPIVAWSSGDTAADTDRSGHYPEDPEEHFIADHDVTGDSPEDRAD
jgi:hypothetical protein